MTKDELFTAIVNDTAGWKAALNSMWSCLNQDDKARATALAGSTTGTGEAAVGCDECSWEFISGGTLALSGTYQSITPPTGAEAAKVQFIGATDADTASFNIEATASPTAPFLVSYGGVITLFSAAEIAAFRMKSTSTSGNAYIQYYSIP